MYDTDEKYRSQEFYRAYEAEQRSKGMAIKQTTRLKPTESEDDRLCRVLWLRTFEQVTQHNLDNTAYMSNVDGDREGIRFSPHEEADEAVRLFKERFGE